MTMSFRDEATEAALHWKHNTDLLPEAARAPGPVNGRGSHDVCLPERYAHCNLLPEALSAIGWFATAGIPWHNRGNGVCTNHLLSSQVQCVNALAPMAFDPDAIRACFDGPLDIAELLPVGALEAPDALVAFEWIPDTDLLREWRGLPGQRGTGNTSIDAVIRYTTSSGAREMALIEWKYVEDYRATPYDDQMLGRRLGRYRRLLEDPDSPIRPDVRHADLIRDPVYQLMRMQLLAWQLEAHNDLDAARVVLCTPGRNTGVLHALPDRLLDSAPPPACDDSNLVELWTGLLTRPDRFVHIDTAALAVQDAPTTADFKVRYGHLAVDPEPAPAQAIAVYRNGDNWRLATVLHRTRGGDVELLDPWVEQLGYAGGALENEWRYLTERLDDGSGGNGITYEIGRHSGPDLHDLRGWAQQVDSDLEAVDPVNPASGTRIEADSWEVIAQLIERHPYLVVIETHQGGGTADALTLFDRDRISWERCISLNREGSAHIAPLTDHGTETRMWRRFWAAWQADSTAAIDELEHRAALPEPSPTPTAASAVYRVIADVLAEANGRSGRWECRNAIEDTTGYGGENREAWFDGFDDARQRSTIALPGTPYGEPGYRFWFILRDRRPIACLEATGRIWSEVGDEHDLGDNPTARAISDAADSILGNA